MQNKYQIAAALACVVFVTSVSLSWAKSCTSRQGFINCTMPACIFNFTAQVCREENRKYYIDIVVSLEDVNHTNCGRTAKFDLAKIESVDSTQTLDDFIRTGEKEAAVKRTPFVPFDTSKTKVYKVVVVTTQNHFNEFYGSVEFQLPFSDTTSDSATQKPVAALVSSSSDTVTSSSGSASQQLPICTYLESFPQTGQWVLNTTLCSSRADCSAKNVSVDQSWYYAPHHCRPRQLTVEQFMTMATKYDLRDIVLAGTSRMRTEFYDLCLFFGKSHTEIGAHKAHNHLSCVRPGGHNISIHLHWFDCQIEILRRTKNMPWGYRENKRVLDENGASLGLCQYRNQQQNNNSSSASSSSSSVSPAVPPVFAGRNHSGMGRYALTFATGACESDRAELRDFQKHYADAFKYVYSSCAGSTGTGIQWNPFLLKSEESVHRKHKFYNYLRESNKHMKAVAEEYGREIGREIPMMDSYHITRSWDTSDDWIHYYKSNNKFFGNVASISVANQMLVAFYTMMERNLKLAEANGTTL